MAPEAKDVVMLYVPDVSFACKILERMVFFILPRLGSMTFLGKYHR